MGISTLDPAQLVRIEAVHGGYLYQHLYAAACLLSLPSLGASKIVVEADEDVELELTTEWLYLQIKKRANQLDLSDIQGALDRFKKLREEHANGSRDRKAVFAIISNVPPGPTLRERIKDPSWPGEVHVCWPEHMPAALKLPLPQEGVDALFAACVELAGAIPFATLVPETLVWKLTGMVMLAASGTPPRANHAFLESELPALIELMITQLQDLPAPPPRYRAQRDEPVLSTGARVRIISGFSGAGKTAWVAQTAQFSSDHVVYFDVGDLPGTAIAVALGRELAARFFGSKGELGKLVLPGASGIEVLRAIDQRLKSEDKEIVIAIDNAHRPPAENIRAIIDSVPHIKFILLGHPGPSFAETEAILEVSSESLRGWSVDTIAAEAAELKCAISYATGEKLQSQTGGLPLYVQNALRISRRDYAGDVGKFVTDLEGMSHSVTTSQEIILSKIFDGLPAETRAITAVASIADAPLSKNQMSLFVCKALGIDENKFLRAVRDLRTLGIMEMFGGDKIKIHDAVRILGSTHRASLDEGITLSAKAVLKEQLRESLVRDKDYSKLSLYLRLLSDLGEIRVLVEFATDELFHEIGAIEEITISLEGAASNQSLAFEQRFAALDGLLFGDMKRGDREAAHRHLGMMREISSSQVLSDHDKLRLAMKAMMVAAYEGDVDEVLKEMEEAAEKLPDSPVYQRVFRYNAANALYHLGMYSRAATEAADLAQEYFAELGISPKGIFRKNPPEIWKMLKKGVDHTDNLKHLADCLDLEAHSAEKLGKHAGLARMYAMKLYAMCNAVQSVVRVGQDLVDEFTRRHDYIGAREVLEKTLLPNVIELKLARYIVPVRSQYAVVLAYCGEHDAAAREMERLAPYEDGLEEPFRTDLQNQRKLVLQLRKAAPPPQWKMPTKLPFKQERNEKCLCGSGKKFKLCHGR